MPNPISWIDPLGLAGEWVNPNNINFSQRTISPHDYADVMRNGGCDWDMSPLRVIDIDGQLVSYDNSLLDAALEAGLDKVKSLGLTLILLILTHLLEKHGHKNCVRDLESEKI